MQLCYVYYLPHYDLIIDFLLTLQQLVCFSVTTKFVQHKATQSYIKVF